MFARWLADPRTLMIAATAGFVWAFAHVLGDLVKTWWSVADYSHGFLIIPMAGYLAWSRRDRIPRRRRPALFWGFGLLILALAANMFGSLTQIPTIEAYAMLPAIAGLVLIVGGWRLLGWAWPMIAFLLFMLPLPHSLATQLARPLQLMASGGAVYLLQCAGVPALAEGIVIHLENTQLNVAFACSGLQMIVSFGAVTTAIALLSIYPWYGKAIIALSAVPIAIVCNVARIALIAWAERFELVPPKEAHDAGGILIVPFTVALVFLGIYLFEKSFPERKRGPLAEPATA